ncbi:MAG: response regulator [Desulfomonile tiedjei]|nr:response regulator [Desulfomonile tiedjei]
MHARKRILVVDDEEANRCLLEAILITLGYEPVIVRDGYEALEVLQPTIDLVLLDVMMPGLDGFEVTRTIRSQSECSDVPIVMVTGLASREDRLRAAEAGANDFITKPIDQVELRIRLKSLLKMKEAQDATRHYQAELEDMVERRTAALRESEMRYRTLFKDSLDPIIMVSKDGQIAEANLAFLTVFDFSAEAIMGMNIRDLSANAEDVSVFEETLRQRGAVREYGWQARTRTGAERYCLLTASCRWDPHGVFLGYQGIIRDITDRKRAEEALRESEARTRTLIESSPIGIMIGVNGIYSYVNPAFVTMLGYEIPDQIVGLPIEALCVPEERGLLQEKAGQALAAADSVSFLDMRGLKSDGEFLDASVWLRSIDLGTGTALLGFVVDVSQEKALRLQLLQAQKMQAMGTLAGGIAHDFNNILFAMMGFTELVLEEQAPGSKTEANLQQVLVAGNRAKELVRQILTFSRQTEEQRHPIQIGPIIKEALNFLRASIPTTISMHRSIAANLGTIMGHPTQIHQVVMNLCTNSAHAMREHGGELLVDLRQVELGPWFSVKNPGTTPGAYLQLTVKDSGNGIAPQLRQRVFEPYFTTKKPSEGTGLGLSVVHGIVQSHRGAIEVDSRVGEGTTIRVYLPVITEAAVEDRPADGSILIGTERVLIVDDEPTIVELERQMLTSLGYDVVTRTDSVEALELFRGGHEHFDLVITDMTMPNLTGMELSRELRQLRPDIPILLVTGFSDQVTEERLSEAGVEAFVMKPVIKRQMAETIRVLLDRPSVANS